MEEHQRGILFNFLNSHELCVLSTERDGQPEAAVVMFGITKDLELVINSFPDSRKVKNISGNHNIAAVIGWGENITIQYEGTAKIVKDSEFEECKEIYRGKNQRGKMWDLKKGMIFIKIKPKWIRYTNINDDPWHIFEVYDF